MQANMATNRDTMGGTMTYRIYSRYPSWAKWRMVTPRPHDERIPFDTKGLRFASIGDAENAVLAMRKANAGEYKIEAE
jgi:hypothetical protein